jgi:hypothetical protein
MQKNLDPSIVFPKRPKNATLNCKARCPECYDTVRYSPQEDGDEVLAANCMFYCERETNRWIDNALCYAKNFLPEFKLTQPKKPKNKKKSSYYKNKKKKVFKSGKNSS